jgi:outer membrane receptor protein involved in Fe transport
LPHTPSSPQDTRKAGAAETADSDEVIVVTGSRIARPEYSLPNPVVGLEAESIEQSGETNLTEFLAEQPALIGSQTSTFSAGSNLLRRSRVGSNFLNLRNPRHRPHARPRRRGPARRRLSRHRRGRHQHHPTDLVEGIDILTGGASAIYGADGVSGVVNFRLKRDFEGVRVRGQTSISQRGDAGDRFVAVTAGTNFADDRGNVHAVVRIQRDGPVQADRPAQLRAHRSRRMRSSRNPDDGPPGAPPTTRPCPTASCSTDLRWADSSPGGAVDLDGDFVPDFTGEGGVLRPRQLRARHRVHHRRIEHTARVVLSATTCPTPAATSPTCSRATSSARRSGSRPKASTSARRPTPFAQPTYDFYTTLFATTPTSTSVTARRRRRRAVLARQLRLRHPPLRARARAVPHRARAEGDITPHLSYDVSYVFGQSTQESTNRNDRISDRYYAALDAVVNPANGQVTCRINLPGPDRRAVEYVQRHQLGRRRPHVHPGPVRCR